MRHLQLILTIHDLAKSLDSGLQSDVIFLDFSKAFNKVDHKLSLHNLDYYGIREGLNYHVKQVTSKAKDSNVSCSGTLNTAQLISKLIVIKA